MGKNLKIPRIASVHRMTDEKVSVLENRKINSKYFKLIFRSSGLLSQVSPGQFLQVRIEDSKDPFLRRPFSYYRASSQRIEILYEILGRGTALLAEKQKGDCLQVMGPLGRPFSVKVPQKKRILVAGGIGVPPLIFLAEKSKADYLLIGIKSKNERLPAQELQGVHAKVLYSTDDGSYGTKGLVTGLLEKVLKREPAAEVFIQTCGPKAMMKEVMAMARSRGIGGEASVDERMACGVGACLGCMVKTTHGWVASCKEGPVFSFDELIL